MWIGTLFALVAGLVWGLVFIAPVLLPEYPPALLSFGRYMAFGLIALPLGWLDRTNLRQLTRSDWREATQLALVGNLLYYCFLATAIQLAGAPLPTVIIGTLPVVIALSANGRNAWRDGKLPWQRLLPSLGLILGGIALVNRAELALLADRGGFDLSHYGLGALLAACGVVCWTWYPIRNADWLRAHPDRNPRTWATAQGLVTLPLAAIGYIGFGLWNGFRADAFPMPFGPRPEAFVITMFAIGLLASWVGTLCWNEASQRLPTAIVGQLIVFETLAALAYALALRGVLPPPGTLIGAALLVAGVLWALQGGGLRPAAQAEPMAH